MPPKSCVIRQPGLKDFYTIGTSEERFFDILHAPRMIAKHYGWNVVKQSGFIIRVTGDQFLPLVNNRVRPVFRILVLFELLNPARDLTECSGKRYSFPDKLGFARFAAIF